MNFIDIEMVLPSKNSVSVLLHVVLSCYFELMEMVKKIDVLTFQLSFLCVSNYTPLLGVDLILIVII